MNADRQDRVREHTDPAVLADLDDAMRDRLFDLAGRDDAAIAARLQALDRERDVERYLETLAPSFALTGIALSLVGGRKWLLLPTAVLGFFLQHAIHGWCPPLAILRRRGVRTRREIEEERYALKALRGDFAGLPPDTPQNRVTRVDTALDAVRL
ncbi:MAG TPA: hypothetical protein VHP37_24670 [Burkholderiales bacterium]|nr:hypothetical protein [Burkholderiales bacterium]